jgi:hypothetical protein
MARALMTSWEGPGRVLRIWSLYVANSSSSFLIFSSTVSPRLFTGYPGARIKSNWIESKIPQSAQNWNRFSYARFPVAHESIQLLARSDARGG